MSVTNETTVPARNTPGRASLVAGIIIVVLQVVQSSLSPLIPFMQANLALSYSSISLFFVPFQVVIGLLSVAALILGIIGLSRRNLPRAAAGAGTALGASALFLLVVSLIANLIYRVAL